MNSVFHSLSSLFRDKSDPHATAPRHIVVAGAVGLTIAALSVGKIAFDELRDYWSIGKPQDLSFDTPVDAELAKQEFLVRGLRSFGLTCFLNATIQALSASPRFEAYLRRAMPYINTDKLSISLFQLLVARYPDISTFYSRVKRNSRLACFADGREHDAQEFLVCLLQELEDAIARGHKAVTQRKHEQTLLLQQQQQQQGPEEDLDLDLDQSGGSSAGPPAPPFLGAETSFRRCRSCGVTETGSTPLAVLSLSLFDTRGGSVALRQLFDTYTVMEQINDVTCDWCTATELARAATAVLRDLGPEVADETAGSYRDGQLEALLEGPVPGLAEDDESSVVMYHRVVAQLRRAHAQLNRLKRGAVSYTELAKVAPGALSTDEEALLLQHVPGWEALLPNPPVKRSVERQIVVSEFPPVMCVHFKRLVGDHKIDSHVDFPVDLDMTAFQQLYQTKAQQAGRGPPMRISSAAVKYRLAAVVVHYGSAYGGHYVTYRRAGRTFGSEIQGRDRISVKPEGTSVSSSLYGDIQVENSKKDSIVSNSSGDICTGDALVPRDHLVGAAVTCDDLCDTEFGSDDDIWWFCSDSTVYPVKIDAVLGQSAYMLTYERV